MKYERSRDKYDTIAGKWPKSLAHQRTMKKGWRSVAFQGIWNTNSFESQHFKPWRSNIPKHVYIRRENFGHSMAQ